jgi:hypothetical protein
MREGPMLGGTQFLAAPFSLVKAREVGQLGHILARGEGEADSRSKGGLCGVCMCVCVCGWVGGDGEIGVSCEWRRSAEEEQRHHSTPLTIATGGREP